MIPFEDAYFWLNIFAASGSPNMHLSFTANRLRGQIEALAGGSPAVITNLINRILFISNGSTDPFERAEIQLVCARSFFIMGHYNEALKQLDEAVKAYLSDSHNQAVVYWMKGCVLRVQGHDVEAIELWQHSLENFTVLAKSQHVQQRGADWYQEKCIEMKDSINAVI